MNEISNSSQCQDGEWKFDMGFVVEAQAEEELPEKLLGAVRVYHMEMSSATFVEASPSLDPVAIVSKRGLGFSKVNHHKSEDVRIEKMKGGQHQKAKSCGKFINFLKLEIFIKWGKVG